MVRHSSMVMSKVRDHILHRLCVVESLMISQAAVMDFVRINSPAIVNLL